METEEIKQHILDEIVKTEKSVEMYREITKPIAPDASIGRISRMDAINNKSVREASLRQAEEKLDGLKRVFSQLGEESFGICRRCHTPIPIKRILVRPESVFCVNCAR